MSLGIISSGASVTVPLGRRGGVIASGRVSYLNLLYSSLLRSSDTDIRYNFNDWNIAGSYALTDRDNIGLQLFGNDDRLGYSDDNYVLDCGMEWGNRLASLRWTHSGDDLDWVQSLFVSRFGNTLSVGLPGFSIGTPSEIMLYGSAGEATLRCGSVAWRIGYGVDYVDLDPQAIGYTDFSNDSGCGSSARIAAMGRVRRRVGAGRSWICGRCRRRGIAVRGVAPRPVCVGRSTLSA